MIAQRLVRKCCVHCAGQGCAECHQGYKGRTGVYQFFAKNGKTFEKSTACLDFQTLRESAEQKLRMGETNEAEISRVLGYV